MRRALLTATAALALGLPACPAAADAGPFATMTAFGDSLSDGGNDSIALGLPQRLRFTTNPGQVAIEDVARHYRITLEPSLAGGTNDAFGGAGVLYNWPYPNPAPTAPSQVDGWLAAHPSLDPRGLYSIWAGSNDVIYHLHAAVAGAAADRLAAQQTAGLPPDQAAQVAAQVRAQAASLAGVASVETAAQAQRGAVAAADTEADLIARLQAAGARHVLIFNLPDIGLTPDGRATGAATATGLAQAFDAELNARLAGRAGIVPVNVFGLIREVAADPRAYGLANATSPACTTDSALLCTPATLVSPDAPSTYLFADGLHPTTAAHLALAEAVIGELDAPGQMSLLAEAPLALLRDHRAAVREALNRDDATGRGWRVFLSGRAGRRSLDGDFAAPGARSDDGAITGGAIWRSGGGLQLGAAITAGRSRTTLQDSLGRFTARELAATAFAQIDASNGAWASLQAGFGRTDYDDVGRSFAIGAALRNEPSSGKGHDASIEAAAGRWFVLNAVRAGPFASFAYDHVHVKGVFETSGDSTAMWFAPQDRDAAVARLALALRSDAGFGGLRLRPVASLAYAHDFRAARRAVTAGLVSLNGQFDMPGYLPARDWGEANLGLEADLGGGFHGRLGYQGLFGDRGRENLGALSISASF